MCIRFLCFDHAWATVEPGTDLPKALHVGVRYISNYGWLYVYYALTLHQRKVEPQPQ